MNYLRSLMTILNHPENRGHAIHTIGKLVWWKLNQVFFKTPVLVPLLENTQILCYPNSSYGSYVFYARYPEYDEMMFMERYLNKNDVVVDVGANIGALTVIAATKAHKGKVFAFEPTSIVEQLRTNVKINNFQNVTISELVVSHKVGTVSFTISDHSEVSHITTPKKNEKSVKKKATSLDAFLDRKVKRVDFLKIDVEGAEFAVLQGARSLLSRQKIGLVLFEFGSKNELYGSTFKTIHTFLSKYGYSVYQFHGQNLVKIDETFVTNKTTNLIAAHSTSKQRLKKFLK